jgi:hypothetical protein
VRLVSLGRLLLPILALAAALWFVLSWHEPAKPRSPGGGSTRFVAADATGHGHRGTLQGRVVTGQTGHDGSAYSFAAPGSWMMVPSSPQLDAGTSDFLVSAWVRSAPVDPDDPAGAATVLTAPGEFRLQLLGSGHVRCGTKDGEGGRASVTSGQPTAGDGEWHRIGCARTGTSWSALVDDDVTFKTAEVGRLRTSAALAIGSRFGLDNGLLDLVDDVQVVIDRDAEPAADPVAAVRALEDRPPVAWWRLDEPATPGRAP